jgi:hypothetical protein
MRCSRCKQEKPPESFNLDPKLRARYDRSSNLMRLYGLARTRDSSTGPRRI